METHDFLDILEQRGIVSANIVSQMRVKADRGDKRITPKAVLKYLVKKELVTRKQAKQLLETTLTVTPLAESSILGMLPMPKPAAQPQNTKKLNDTIPTLDPVEEEPPVAEKGMVSLAPEDPTQDEMGNMLSDSIAEAQAEEDLPDQEERAKKAKKRKSKKKKKKENEWDSPLVVFGGGGLILLIIVGSITYFLINREDAEAVLSEASSFFDGGSYTQAIKQYEHFVETFEGHPQFSTAKVKLGLARLWAARSKSNFPVALETAKEVLDEIEDEEEFKKIAQADLASLLPAISQGLASDAERAKEATKIDNLIDLTNKSLALCNNTKYITKNQRDEVILNEVRETLERVKRERVQEEQLAKALDEMQLAITQQNTLEAYAIHKRLLEEYPALLKDETLAAKVLEISKAESSVVKYNAESINALKEERPDNTVASLTLAHRINRANTGVSGTTVIRVGGGVFGISNTDGEVLWRKFLGIAPQLPPLNVPGENVILVDDRNNDLLKISSTSGELIWRLELDSPLTLPVHYEQNLFVADQSGKLHIVDLTTGERTGYIQFAQKLQASPVLSGSSRRIYQVGEHSSLYTISAEDYSCLGVYFLGHEVGSISQPPVVALNKVIVAENTGSSSSQIKVLSTDKFGVVTNETTSRKLEGRVNTDLLVTGRRLVAVTDRGQVTVYETGSGEDESALTRIATRDAEKAVAVMRYGLVEKGNVWLAGKKLTKLAVVPTGNRLPVQDTDRDYLGDFFDHRLQTVENILIHVRRPKRQGGAIVSAMETKTGKALWETLIAEPLVGSPTIDTTDSKVTAVSSSGNGYILDRQSLRRRIQDEASRLPTSARRSLTAMNTSLDLGQGRILACMLGADNLLHFQPHTLRNTLKKIKLASPISCKPIAWENDFVVPTNIGQVYLFDSETGEQNGSPFQPTLSPGSEYNWLTPSIFEDNENSFLVITDGNKKIYLISKEPTPQPHLESIVEADVGSSQLNSRISVLNDIACAGTTDGSIALYKLPSLEGQPKVDIGANVTWGPYALENNWILTTDTEELLCLDSQGQISWRETLTRGPVSSEPFSDQGHAYLLWQSGGISRVSIADGSEQGFLELQQPAIGGPVPFGSRLMISTSDGTLLITERP